MSANDIPEWATKEICRRTGECHHRLMAGTLSSGVARVIRVAAEILAAHEEAPVDPLAEEVQRIADFNRINLSAMPRVEDALMRALRRGIELAKAGEA